MTTILSKTADDNSPSEMQNQNRQSSNVCLIESSDTTMQLQQSLISKKCTLKIYSGQQKMTAWCQFSQLLHISQEVFWYFGTRKNSCNIPSAFFSLEVEFSPNSQQLRDLRFNQVQYSTYIFCCQTILRLRSVFLKLIGVDT